MTQMTDNINFFRGHPTDSLLATKEILHGVQSLLGKPSRPEDTDDESRNPLTYGPDPGALSVRKLIAEWSGKAHGDTSTINPDAINLTNGASYGAQTALQQATAAQVGFTKRAFIITPTYFLINAIFHDAGFYNKLTAIPESPVDGVDLHYLESQFEKYDKNEPDVDQAVVDQMLGVSDPKRKVYKFVIYLVPTFSNPIGSSMSLEKRKKLLELARKYDALILCDDVYDLLDYRNGTVEKLPRLVTLDRETVTNTHGNTLSNCTFSKLLGPGVRVGWMETATPALATQCSQGGSIKSGGTPSHMNTMVVGELLKDGTVDKVISNLNKVYKERAAVMKQNLQNHLPQGTNIQGGTGGYFFWITLPEGYNAEKITKECADKGVILASEGNFQVAGDEMLDGRSFRVSLSYETADRAAEGIKIWGQVCAAQ